MAAYIIGSDKAFLRIRCECPICEMVKKLSCLMIATLDNLVSYSEKEIKNCVHANQDADLLDIPFAIHRRGEVLDLLCFVDRSPARAGGAILTLGNFSFSCGETPAAAALAGAESFVVATHRASVGSGIFPALLD